MFPRRPTLPFQAVRHNGALVPTDSLDFGDGVGYKLQFERLQQLTAASAHGGGAVCRQKLQDGHEAFSQERIALGKVGESLHGKGFYDAALVFEIVKEDCDGVVAFSWCELEARKYLSYVPADFLLRDYGDSLKNYVFMGLQELRV